MPNRESFANISCFIIGLCCFPLSARSDNSDAQMWEAATVALTGHSDAPLQIDDYGKCVFSLRHSRSNGSYDSTIFYLNNVYTNRITAQDFENRNLGTRWTDIHLYGGDPITETEGITVMAPQLGKLLGYDRIIDKLTEHREHTITVDFPEKERVISAWRYLYSKWCKGQRSPF